MATPSNTRWISFRRHVCGSLSPHIHNLSTVLSRTPYLAMATPVIFFVIGQLPVISGAIIHSRPIGVLLMEDQSGMVEKILAVPVDELRPFYVKINSYEDLPEILCEQIAHFFQHYKDLEKGKWVKKPEMGGTRGSKKDYNGSHYASQK